RRCASRVQVHFRAFHGKGAWFSRRVRVHRNDPMDRLWILFRAAPGLFTYSICCRSGRILFQGVWFVAPQEELPARFTAGRRRNRDWVQLLFTRYCHRSAADHAYSGPVYWTDWCRDLVAEAPTRLGETLSHLPVSTAGVNRA